MQIENKIKELGYELPTAPAPVATYVGAVRVGNLVFLSGHGPKIVGREEIAGKVDSEVSIERAQEAARMVGLNLLATLKNEIGDLDKVKRIVKVLGMVNADPSFTEHPRVINGFSDMMVEIFGDKGRGARSAVGMGSLPFRIPVEIEMVVEVD